MIVFASVEREKNGEYCFNCNYFILLGFYTRYVYYCLKIGFKKKNAIKENKKINRAMDLRLDAKTEQTVQQKP